MWIIVSSLLVGLFFGYWIGVIHALRKVDRGLREKALAERWKENSEFDMAHH